MMGAQPLATLAAGLVLVLGASFVSVGSLAGSGDVPPEVRGQIVGLVAVVGSIWQDDERYLKFHRELTGKFADTPALEPFRATEQWLSAYSSRSVRFPGVFNARAKRDKAVNEGDIVRIRLAEYRKVDSYFQLSEVEEVLCRAGAEGFAECAARNPLAWVLQSGERVSR